MSALRDRYLRRSRAQAVDAVLAKQTRIVADRAALIELVRTAPQRAYIAVIMFDPWDTTEPFRYRAVDEDGATSTYKDNFAAQVFARNTFDASLGFINYVEVHKESDADDA